MSDDESWKCFLNVPIVSSDAQLGNEIVNEQETYQTAIEDELFNLQQFSSSPSSNHLSQAVAAAECDKKIPLTVISVQDTVRHSSFAGEYNFKVRFAPQKKIAKAALWTFSESLQKLYANVNKECPVCFCVTRPLPFGAKIRCKAVYTSINHQQDVVTRCWNHIVQSSANSSIPNYHFILCDNRSATYHDDLSTGQQSVTATFEPDGNLQAVLVFRFMCFSSCVGNMTRRQIDVVFSLETETGTVLGRQVFELKICACPGRDRREDELNRVREGADLPTKRVKRRSETSPSGESKTLKILTETLSNQPASENDDDDQVYSIEVRGKRMYNYVVAVIKAAQELRDGQLDSSPLQSVQQPVPKSKPVVSTNVQVVGVCKV